MLRTFRRFSTKYNPSLASGFHGKNATSTSTSASQDEIHHFQQLAPSWWDVWGPQRILHKMNLARMDFIQKVLFSQVKAKSDTFVPGFNHQELLPKTVSTAIERELNNDIRSQLGKKHLKILDIGCGGGILAECLARLPYVSTVQGIDLTPQCIDVAKEHAKSDPILKNKLSYKVQSLEDVTDRFDVITCLEMLEHVDQPSEILRHAWGKLNPGGILFLSTINRDLVSWFTTIFMGEQVLGIVPRGTHHLSKYINATEIEDWFRNEYPRSHEVLDCKGTMYLPLTGWVNHDCTRIGNYFMAVKKLK